MPGKFTVFISSTVYDFAPVRADIADWLRSRGIEVRESEDPEFPVQPSVHSFDACLNAIEGCNAVILLVGKRYGGCHLNSTQSITWREHDEAVNLQIPVIKLVLRDVNEEALRLHRSKAKTTRKRGAKSKASAASEIDPRVFDFIAHIRKGARDNWTHLDWDGSFSAARKRIDSRLNSLFVAYQGRHRKLASAAERLLEYSAARRLIDSMFVAFQAEARKPSADPEEAVRGRELFLELLAQHRGVLFGFEETDLYNFAIYALAGSRLKVVARCAHPDIKQHNRDWKLGQGHVGITAERGCTHISPNLRFSSGWKPGFKSDSKNYVSAIAVPAGTQTSVTSVAGVFIVTSSRADHFRSSDQQEVLTAESMALMLGALNAFSITES